MNFNLSSSKITAEIIKKYGFNMTKSLEQNFLINENILDKIIESADISSDDVVLEIGTGIGTLTQRLCENAKKVIAVEIDKNLIHDGKRPGFGGAINSAQLRLQQIRAAEHEAAAAYAQEGVFFIRQIESICPPLPIFAIPVVTMGSW